MKVKLYTTPSCPHCTSVKRYLRENNVPFTEYNIARDPRKAEEAHKKSGQYGVPVVDIKGRVLVGFSKSDIDRALKR